MLALRALRSGTARIPASSRASSVASLRGYATATTSEEAPQIDAAIYNKKVDMSVIEKGKGYYINYKKNAENIDVVRQRYVVQVQVLSFLS